MERNNGDSSSDDDSIVEPNRLSSFDNNVHPKPNSEESSDIDTIPRSVPNVVPSLETTVDPASSPVANLDVTLFDINPDSTGTIVEQDGVIYMERQLGDDEYSINLSTCTIIRTRQLILLVMDLNTGHFVMMHQL